jgi:DNA helicase-2/ATP-dependent DNA helicase PcrA
MLSAGVSGFGSSSSFGSGVHRGGRKLDAQVIALNVGDRVTHEKFGLGTVVETGGMGDKADATIDFGSAGIKRLLLRYAPVEKL